MAHMTKVNGTAYDIVGGLTKVNGTDYDIIKGKTKVGGTDYDIEFASGFTWNGWNNATWQDIVNLVQAKKDGIIDSFPDDVVVGQKKLLQLLSSSSPWSAGQWYAYLVAIGTNSLYFQWQTTTPSSTVINASGLPSVVSKINTLNAISGATAIDNNMKSRGTYWQVYYSYSWHRLTPATGRFFLPTVKWWNPGTSTNAGGQEPGGDIKLTIPQQVGSTSYNFLIPSTGSGQNSVYYGKSASTTSISTHSTLSLYLFPCFEIVGT